MRFPVSYVALGLCEESKFNKLVAKLRKRKGVRDPEALAAAIGRKNGKIESDLEPSEPDTPDDVHEDACMDETRHQIARAILGLTESRGDPGVLSAMNTLSHRLGLDGKSAVEFRPGSSAKTDVYTLRLRNYRFFKARRGEEDDDQPDFVGHDQVEREVRSAIKNLPVQISYIRPEEKGWFVIVLLGK